MGKKNRNKTKKNTATAAVKGMIGGMNDFATKIVEKYVVEELEGVAKEGQIVIHVISDIPVYITDNGKVVLFLEFKVIGHDIDTGLVIDGVPNPVFLMGDAYQEKIQTAFDKMIGTTKNEKPIVH